MKKVSSWGRLSGDYHIINPLLDRFTAGHLISQDKNHQGIAFGMGRSYGDVALNPESILWLTSSLNHFVSFDETTGRLICEAGVLLGEIQKCFIPRGWSLPVTPGTQLATVGGAIANDVHGKNHHLMGTFGDHVKKICLLRTTGETIECGPDHNQQWFTATVGGLGLTGVIVTAEIQLRKTNGPWLEQESIPYSNLTEFTALANESEEGWEHTVSWIDCMSGNGRGIFMRANPCLETHNSPYKTKSNKEITFIPPFSLINRATLRPLNFAYYNFNQLKKSKNIVHYEPFFYPLDKILQWNRLYGPKGFYQYQSVVPKNTSHDATNAMLKEIKKSGEGSFLGVLKTFGDRRSIGMLSFPEPGVTLALDFPNNGASTQRLLDRLDSIVREAKGRIYAAKDARMPRDLFASGYPKLNEFLQFKDPGISSSLSRRLIES